MLPRRRIVARGAVADIMDPIDPSTVSAYNYESYLLDTPLPAISWGLRVSRACRSGGFERGFWSWSSGRLGWVKTVVVSLKLSDSCTNDAMTESEVCKLSYVVLNGIFASAYYLLCHQRSPPIN